MPNAAYLVVPTGTVLPPKILATTVKGFDPSKVDLDDDPLLATTGYVFNPLERDTYLINLSYEATIEFDVDCLIGEGVNLVPVSPWSAVFHSYENGDDIEIFVTVHRGVEMGQVIFCTDGEGDVRLQLDANFTVNEEALEYIRTFGRLVRAINNGD